MVPLSKEYDTFEDESITSVEDRIKFFGQYDHVRLYGLDFKEKLKSVFSTVYVNTIDELDQNDVKKFCLKNDSGAFEPIYCVQNNTII